VDSAVAMQPVKCTGARGGGDTPDQIDRSEGIQIVFDTQVVIEAMKLSQWDDTDIVEVQIFDGNTEIAIQRYEEADVVFGASTAADVAQACPDVDGRKLCRGTKILIYHASAINTDRGSDVGQLVNGVCQPKNIGAGFSLDNIVVSTTKAVMGGAVGKPSSFDGYCTGAPGGDYTNCQNQDVCYMSPPRNPQGAPTDVQIVLVPAGQCGPKGWVPQIDFKQGNGKIIAAYKSVCTCGTATETLTGTGPLPTAGKKFRPLLDLYRVQDRAGGNDDANRKEQEPGSETTGVSSLVLVASAVIAAVLAIVV